MAVVFILRGQACISSGKLSAIASWLPGLSTAAQIWNKTLKPFVTKLWPRFLQHTQSTSCAMSTICFQHSPPQTSRESEALQQVQLCSIANSGKHTNFTARGSARTMLHEIWASFYGSLIEVDPGKQPFCKCSVGEKHTFQLETVSNTFIKRFAQFALYHTTILGLTSAIVPGSVQSILSWHTFWQLGLFVDSGCRQVLQWPFCAHVPHASAHETICRVAPDVPLEQDKNKTDRKCKLFLIFLVRGRLPCASCSWKVRCLATFWLSAVIVTSCILGTSN